ncbi:acyl-CoA dehydrogenase [Mycobacterium lehmannii]|uniref:Acyl-CoA dehydrogenase n=1 Tax=Mycobacterium lehmannii TaxID=2048550 RepID=A0A100ZZH8_9MYCO|nr:acyl-CoA dehydrogenase family protein [Mycobacterium lehmannii]KUI06430.1 acyl-CoA dehydrogenase [Mycobacterium lehmannii]
MDFRYSTEQVDFRAALRGFLAEAAPLPRVRDIAGLGGHDQRLWQRVCSELELPALHLPPEYGGAGGTVAEAAIAFEELGRALTPVPLAGSVLAIETVLRAGNAEQRQRLLPGLLSGERIGAFTAAGPDAADPATATVRAGLRSGLPVLHGECSPVLHGHVADLFVVPAETDGTVTPFVVTADAPGVTVQPLPSFDATRPVARLTFAHAPAEPLTGSDGLDRVLDVARVLLAAEMLGGAEACLALSVEYAGSRRQFDRPIGSFQAVKHACAEMMIEIDATRVAVMFAAMSAAEPDQLAITAPLVKAQAADTFALCAGSAIQVHGGIAFTWEHDVHLYFRRAKTTEALFGSSTHHRALLADRVGL